MGARESEWMCLHRSTAESSGVRRDWRPKRHAVLEPQPQKSATLLSSFLEAWHQGERGEEAARQQQSHGSAGYTHQRPMQLDAARLSLRSAGMA